MGTQRAHTSLMGAGCECAGRGQCGEAPAADPAEPKIEKVFTRELIVWESRVIPDKYGGASIGQHRLHGHGRMGRWYDTGEAAHLKTACGRHFLVFMDDQRIGRALGEQLLEVQAR